MGNLRLVLGDQLSTSLASLADLKMGDTVLMAEVAEEAGYVNHHQKKIAFIFSAMRHFAEELRQDGVNVVYVKFDDPENTGSLRGEVERAVHRINPSRLILTEPGEFRLREEFGTWEDVFGLSVELRPDTRFLTTIQAFSSWAEGRKSLRMEFFYRQARRQHQILMNGEDPEGGQWNFDQENRQPPREGVKPPATFRVEPDAITRDVLDLVRQKFSHHFGHLDGFGYAVCRKDALKAVDLFIEERLPHFGTWQDAMVDGEPWMYHAHIGLYLNAGLLLPLEVIRRAEQAWHEGKAPLNAVEGFIRQILGWREYVRGIYWLNMPQYASANALGAHRPLPDFYWTADTDMRCLQQCVTETRDNAYAHHIQRLMVLGNFALLAGIDPAEVNAWYLAVYADAYEWVELPNVSGMTLYADDGYLASKPYAASGAYINRMSTYCRRCRYKVAAKSGPDACPFNYLYWDFLIRNRGRLKNNPRMGMPYRTLDRMDAGKIEIIRHDSRRFLDGLD
ncbi:cryptochrome/photolyase family protein [Alphaproteobacteria bacterium LSUCC0684]